MAKGISINPYITTAVKFYSLDMVNTVINTVPNIPPIMKVVSTTALQGAKIKLVVDFVRKSDVPGPVKTMIAAIAAIGSLQSLITLMPTLQEMFKTGFLSQG